MPHMKRTGAGRAVLALVLSVFTGTTAVADATLNPRIKVKVTSLTKSTAYGDELPGSLTVSDIVKMSFTWDATTANPAPGESFTIRLPEEFVAYAQPQTKALVFEGAEVGSCELHSAVLTCQFNDGILGKINIRGNGSALLVAVKATDETSTTFDANGTRPGRA